MTENYLNNLIYTKYVHDVQILEDVTDVINEYIPKKDEKKLEHPIELKKSTKIKQKSKPGKSINDMPADRQEKQIINFDVAEIVTNKVNRKDEVAEIITKKVIENREVVNVAKPKEDLLEFDYIRVDYSNEKKIILESETHPFKNWLDLLNKEKLSHKDKKGKDKTRKKNKGSNHLIDEFIESNPKIVTDRENKSDKDFSAESVEEKTELFTETLANIYIKQKAYEKAILAYEKLSLKYPEKSTYFANQIKNIKKISNNE